MGRVSALGKGRVIPFEGDDAPLVLPRSFQEDALKKALAQGQFPLSYTLLRENSSFRPRYLEVTAGLSLSKGERASGETIRSLLHEERLICRLEEGEITSFFKAYKEHSKAFKSSSLKGIIFQVCKGSLFSPTYMRLLSRGIKDAKVPGNYVYLRIPLEFAEEEQEKLRAALAQLKDMHVRVIQTFGIGDLGGSLAYLPPEALAEAMVQEKGEEALKRTLEEARAMGCGLILTGVDGRREQSYAISLSLPYGKGELYGTNIDEEALLAALN